MIHLHPFSIQIQYNTSVSIRYGMHVICSCNHHYAFGKCMQKHETLMWLKIHIYVILMLYKYAAHIGCTWPTTYLLVVGQYVCPLKWCSTYVFLKRIFPSQKPQSASLQRNGLQLEIATICNWNNFFRCVSRRHNHKTNIFTSTNK